MRRTIAALIIAGLCLLSFPTTAQQSGVVSDDDFTKLDQQIRKLKNPTFRAFLRTRLLSWEVTSPSPARRQAARAVAIQGISDLCDHQDEVGTPTASWLHEGFVKQIRVLQSAEDTALAICVLKTDATSSVARDLSSGIKLLRSPDTSEAGLDLARSAILSGQVSASAMLGQLSSSTVARSPHLPALLDAVLSLEEKQPGMLPLRLLPFFSSVFLEKSVPPEITTRFLTV